MPFMKLMLVQLVHVLVLSRFDALIAFAECIFKNKEQQLIGKGKDMYVDKITEVAKMEYAYHLPLTNKMESNSTKKMEEEIESHSHITNLSLKSPNRQIIEQTQTTKH